MPPELLPTTAVPRFSAALEADIDTTLTERLGREPTAEERSDYRLVLWAFASAINAILDDQPSTPLLPCPASPFMPANPASPTTGSV
jgi:hypothetical protein